MQRGKETRNKGKEPTGRVEPKNKSELKEKKESKAN